MTACIWYISKYVAPSGGTGPGGRGYEIMRELAIMGHEAIVITSDANHLTEVPVFEGKRLLVNRDGMLVCWLRTLKSDQPRSWRRIAGWLHFEWALLRLPKRILRRPDVVVVSSLSLLTILNGILLKARFRTRLVFEIRDIWPLTLVEDGGFSPRNLFVRALGVIERLGYRHADAIVGTMPNLEAHVTEVLGRTRQVHCIPMGYSPAAISASEVPEGYLESFVPQDAFVVVYAGTVGVSNALETFFESAQTLRDHPQIRFMVVGDGSMLPDYKARYSHLPNLVFAPKVPKHSVQPILTACDLVYLSAGRNRIWQYGQSLNKLVDYMLSGNPVVASYEGFPSMINEAGCGSFVAPGDADALVAELMRYEAMDAEERRAIGARGRTWILEHRSYEQLAKDYLPILLPTA